MAVGKNSRVVEKRDIGAHKEPRILDIKYPCRSPSPSLSLSLSLEAQMVTFIVADTRRDRRAFLISLHQRSIHSAYLKRTREANKLDAHASNFSHH